MPTVWSPIRTHPFNSGVHSWHDIVVMGDTLKPNKLMKKNLSFLMLAFAFFLLQSCGPKSEDNSTANATEAATEQARAEEERIAKRARIETARIAKLEERRLAAIEKAKTEPTYKDASGKVIYNKAEVDPTFVGGDNAMMEYLRANLTYPEQAQKDGVEGTVFVDFIIDQKGNVRDIVATDVVGENVDQALKDEAVRVVTGMPTWAPGTQRGVAVDARYSVPITFQLTN